MLVSASSAGKHRHVSDRPVSDRPVCIGGYYIRFYSLSSPADKTKILARVWGHLLATQVSKKFEVGSQGLD